MDLDAVFKPFSTERARDIGCDIDEKHRAGDIVFLTQLDEKRSTDRDCIRRKEPRMKDSVRLRIDCSVQPVFLECSSSLTQIHSGWL
ncbi:hypothetical protein C487_09832 [Natrinema pallidum DSM 3751]|uniref:Uncharacterized protein n=2 Tax=Natrinema TaxID=88723 RepID=L9Y6C5_NATP1|nr:hypothetical protein C488_20177 [Natrinema pellirubrum DSM 15624]ELY77022.1 hypothetical protein C487_09832 [Natrinema pallidum DSM 3751]